MAEVRTRALRSIGFKLQHALVKEAELAMDSLLLRNLLNWFNLDAPGEETTVLALLARLAAHPHGASRLMALSADAFLKDLRANRCDSR
jgi:hypothetical protein